MKTLYLSNWTEKFFIKSVYLNIKDKDGKSQIIIDKKRAPIIKKLFKEYATGLHSSCSLLQLACNMGLISKQPKYYKSSPDYQKKNFVCRNTIISILRNPFYYGMMCVKGKLIPHIHGKIISKELFDRVQEILDSKHKGSKQQQLSKYFPVREPLKLTFLVTFRYDLDGITNLRTKFNSPTLRTEG